MNTKQNKAEDIFKPLFESEGVQSPGKDFTANIMTKINELEAEQVSENKLTFPLYVWILSFVGIGCIIATLVVLSNYGYIQLIPENFEFILIPMFKSVLLSFREIFSAVSISSTSIAIIAALSIIIVFDRILKITPIGKNNYLFTL